MFPILNPPPSSLPIPSLWVVFWLGIEVYVLFFLLSLERHYCSIFFFTVPDGKYAVIFIFVTLHITFLYFLYALSSVHVISVMLCHYEKFLLLCSKVHLSFCVISNWPLILFNVFFISFIIVLISRS